MTALAARDLDNPELRTDQAGQAGSKVAAIPGVRTNLLKFQQKFAYQASGAVLDGRDIGTVICPDAAIKLFVTASPEARAERRYQELRESGAALIKPRVLAEMAERDRRDSERAAAPLKAAPDAYLLDTSVIIDALNDKRVLGVPLGYFLVCHGLIVIAFVTMAGFVNRQDAIDRSHGAHEDF